MNNKVMVAGAGKSGIAAARLLAEMGGEVLLYDSNEKLNIEEVMKKLPSGSNIKIRTGELRNTDVVGCSMCIMSPGISCEAPFVKLLDEKKIPLWSEIELASYVSKGTIVAITGTNGKTTTTALTGKIMERKYSDTYVVGNIGTPFTEAALKTTDDSVIVHETSSFQLETIIDFHPHVSAILNITPDHLDRHHTLENYIAIKKDITMNQTKDDYVVLNYEDDVLREFGTGDECPATAVFFSSKRKLAEGIYLDNGEIVRAHEGRIVSIIAIDDLKLLGEHNHENVMAAIAMGFCMGVDIQDIRQACKEFTAVEHRIEYVLERTGVKYYNDSKGTNPDAAIRAVRAMPGPIILIAGGYDKHSEYDEWIEECVGRVKHLILLGQTRDAISECARKHGITEIMYAESMEEAVSVAASYADPGDCVLLSPACASWGMFNNYEERGRIFKDAVRAL